MKCLQILFLSYVLSLSVDSSYLSAPTPNITQYPNFEEIIAQTTSPEFEHLLARHRIVLQNGYANVLLEVLYQDSLGGIISFLKCKLHKTFSLPHTQLVKVIPIPQQQITTPIILNYTNGYIVIEWGQNKIYRYILDDFPTDPWQKTAQ